MGSRKTCDCWHDDIIKSLKCWGNVVSEEHRYTCWGTKEREICKCGGDQTKCDFYPEVRKKAPRQTMTRAEAEKRLGCKIID